MKFNEMNRTQQAATRRAHTKLLAEGWAVSASKIAQHLDTVEDYLNGALTAFQLAKATHWAAPSTPEPEAEAAPVAEGDDVDPATALANAVATVKAANEALTRIMLAARAAGKSANAIARHVAPLYSRPTALAILNETDLRTRATAALLDAGFTLDDFRLFTGPGRMVLVQLTAEDADGSGTAMNTASAILNALKDAGLSTSVHDGDPFERLEHMAAGGEMVVTTGE